MDREIPVLNRVIHRIDQQRNNHILTDKIMHMKVSSNSFSLPIFQHFKIVLKLVAIKNFSNNNTIKLIILKEK